MQVGRQAGRQVIQIAHHIPIRDRWLGRKYSRVRRKVLCRMCSEMRLEMVRSGRQITLEWKQMQGWRSKYVRNLDVYRKPEDSIEIII